jgi:hypothetical protein
MRGNSTRGMWLFIAFALFAAAGAVVWSPAPAGTASSHAPEWIAADWSWALLAFGMVLVLWCIPVNRRQKEICFRLASLSWSRNDFCRGWYISGTTGSGKTEAIKLMVHLLCRGEKDWGGLFIDEKGFFVDEVLPILRAYGRGGDICELRVRPDGAHSTWEPPFRFNILGDPLVRTSQYVEAILAVAEANASGKEDNGFFKTQAGLHIGAAIDLFRGLREWQRAVGRPEAEWVAPTLRGIYEILTSEGEFEALLCSRAGLFVRRQTAEGAAVEPEFRGHAPSLLIQALEHFQKRYWHVRAQEQLEGVKATIVNYLRWFTDDEIHRVFGAEDANFSIADVDLGKLICLSLPQRYAIERRYLCALLKVLTYSHARSRQAAKRQYNLLVLWQDEAQRFILPVDGDVDILRQYQVTTVIATQFRAQLEQALGGRENAAPVLGNLRNRIILQAADEDCAEDSAKFIGKGLRRRRSYTRQQDGKRSMSYNEEVVYRIEPYQLRQLPKFVAVVCHASGLYRVVQFTPLTPEGRVPEWFMSHARLPLRLKLWLGARPPVYCGYAPPRRWVHS